MGSRSLERRLLLGTIALAVGCGDCESEAVREELDGRLAAASVIYHGGCDMEGACSLPSRACGADVEARLRTAVAAGEAVFEWEYSGSMVGSRNYYWFIRPDGSGAHYYEELSDTIPSGCDSYCGWHRTDYGAGQLLDAGGQFHLRPGGDSDSAIEIFDGCGWPGTI
jgi:hypothetical protein